MYAHQVIEDLKSSGNKEYINEIKSSFKFYIDSSNEILKFFLKNLEKEGVFRNGKIYPEKFIELNSTFLKLPYNRTFIEYNYHCYDCPNTHKSCLLLIDISGTEIFHKTNIKSKNMFYLVLYEFSLVRKQYIECDQSIVVDVENFKTYPFIKKQPNAPDNPEKFINNEKELLLQSAFTACLFIKLLNCKNVSYEKHYPPEALNKKRTKEGKQPLFTYHTLVVNPIGSKHKSEEPYEKTGIKQRLHFCRGHFKEYTQESPLFGKLTGLYWWQPFVRGNKQLGIVHKDYKVKSVPQTSPKR